MMTPLSVGSGRVAKGAVMAGEAVSEFAAVVRARIADARGELARAGEAGDLEAMTALGLRLRYLLEVAADGGVELDDALGTGSGEGGAGGGSG